MPIELKPVVRRQGGSFDLSPGGDWNWLGRQEFSYDRIWQNTTAGRRGTLTGGPTTEQFLTLGDYRAHAIYPPKPQITTPVLTGERLGQRTKWGTVEIDFIDPFSSIAQLTGDAIGLSEPLIGDGGQQADPEDFLRSKGIDLFGVGSTGAPGRLADYTLAVPIAVMNKLRGISTGPAEDDGLHYRFQRDPGYWGLVQMLDEEQLAGLARTVAGRYVDVNANSYTADRLLEQMRKDRNIALGFSSGNERIDYLAKLELQNNRLGVFGPDSTIAPQLQLRSAGFGNFLAAIPFLGTQLAESIDPIRPETEREWEALDRETRGHLLQQYGMATAAGDVVMALPLLSGMGSILAIAKAAGGAAGAAYRGYDLTLRAANATMAAGLGVAIANWGLEAAVPGYSDFIGNEIDRARPISGSALAGVVNEIGFWSSGTFGAYTLGKLAGRTSSRAAGAVQRAAATRGIETPTIRGSKELAFFRHVYGGSEARNELAGAGLDPNLVDLSAKRSFLSYASNYVEAQVRRLWDAALKGEKTGMAEVDDLDFAAKQELANEYLARRAANHGPEVEGILRILQLARTPRPLNAADDVVRAWQVAQKIARTFDDELARTASHEFGAPFITRIIGEYTPEAAERWARAKLDELGGDGSKLGRHDSEGWDRIVRALHQYEFDWWNGEKQAAIEAAPLEEAGRTSVVRNDHLFVDVVDDALPVLRGDDPLLATEKVVELITGTKELGEWFVREWNPPAGVQRAPGNVKPAQVADYIEEIRPALPTRRRLPDAADPTAAMPFNAMQRAMEERGTWTIGYKPVNEAGDFVSYVRTRSGAVFKSPWLDYPLENVDNLELGNRGWLGSKWDSVFRAFRTWRITEFQRASLFRSLSSKVPGFTPAQIDRFHDGVMQIARDEKVQAQTVGAMAKLDHQVPFAPHVHEKLNALADAVFGKGPFVGRDGIPVEIDWPAEVTRGYRQSLKLNLTAGLTSHLKDRLGMGGAVAALGSDFVYVLWRFTLSPIFKVGELGETAAFNLMRGVSPRGDALSEALYYRGGVGNDYALVSQELAHDQMIPSMTDTRGLPTTQDARNAAALAFHARQRPRTLATDVEEAATRAVARQRPFRPAEGLEAWRISDEWGVSPTEAEAMVAAAEMVPVDVLVPLREVDRAVEAREAGVDAMAALATLRDDIATNGVRAPIEVWWDPATNRAVIADGNHRLAVALQEGIDELPAFVKAATTDEVSGSMTFGTLAQPKQARVPPNGILRPSQIFGEADAALDLPPVAAGDRDRLLDQLRATFREEPTPEAQRANALRSELDEMIGEGGVEPGLELRAQEILDELRALEAGPGGPVWTLEEAPRDLRDRFLAERPDINAQIGVSRGGSAESGGAVLAGPTSRVAPATWTNRIADASADVDDHLYHTTGVANLDDIAREGLQPMDPTFRGEQDVWPDGSPDPRVYFGTSPERVAPFVSPDDGFPALLRVRRRGDGLRAERGTGDWISEAAISPRRIEYFGRDGRWHRLSELDGAAPPAQGRTDFPPEAEEAFARWQRESADRLEDVPGTAEALFAVAEERVPELVRPERSRSALRRAAEAFWNPTAPKQRQATKQQIDIMRREFPSLLRLSKNDGLIAVFKTLGLPENRWADWLLEDRRLLVELDNAARRGPEALGEATAKYMGHAGPDARGVFDEFYASEEWQVLTSLWHLNLKGAQDEAFGTHFFQPFRSAFERSINHPVLGVYPASWAYKAAREWGRFLFANRTFGELRLGMAPSVAIAQIVRAQQSAFAQANPEELDAFLENGPLGSTIFIFNLLMPGDWSAIPFPASRTVRELLRGNVDPVALWNANLNFLGATRDVRLIGESVGEIRDLLFGPEPEDPDTSIREWSVRGQGDLGAGARR